MSIYLNREAAELLDLAAKSHRRAADCLELGDIQGCIDYAQDGNERANVALQSSLEAQRESANIHIAMESVPSGHSRFSERTASVD